MNLRILVLVVVSSLSARSALGITYGVPDGDGHPEVGALVGTFSSGTFTYCSGTLISPTVFLTAAHCDIGNARVLVTFDPAFTDKAKLYAGTYYADPAYGSTGDDPHDVAVVVLDKPILHITPARLPGAGELDALRQGTAITSVGYGSQEPVAQPGGVVNESLDVREVATGTLNAVTPAWLHISQVPATDNGGTCYGDSGGPNFLGAGDTETNLVAATTITGDMFCHATNTTYRMDLASVRSFLGVFVPLP